MKKQFLAILALASLTAFLVAQSPPPTPTEIGQNQEQHSTSEQANSNPALQTIPGATAGNHSAEDQSGHRRKESPDSWNNWVIALLTFVIAGAAVVQVWAMIRQADYMRRGLLVTVKAARSARFGARAAMRAVEHAERTTAVTERAIVLIDSVSLSTEGLMPGTVIIFTLKNFGRTVAYRVKLTGFWEALGKEPIQERPETDIAPEGTSEWISRSIGLTLTPGQISDVQHHKIRLGYKIEVMYADAFQKNHRYEAEGRFEPGGALRRFLNTRSTSD